MTAQPFDRDALPAELAERWITPEGRELIEIAPREDVSETLYLDTLKAIKSQLLTVQMAGTQHEGYE